MGNFTGSADGFGQTQQFPLTDNNRNSGASRQIGEFGHYPVGQVDVRTPLMKALEGASAPMLLSTLTNPGGVLQTMQQASGPMPNTGPSALASMIFGGGGAAPPQPGGQVPGPFPINIPPMPIDNGGFGGGVNPPAAELPPGGGPVPPGSQTIIPGNTGGVVPVGGGSGNPAQPLSPVHTGTQLGGGQVPVDAPVPPSLTNLMDILGQFAGVSSGAPGMGQLTHGFTGLVQGSGPPGQELNLGMLNSFLHPQGYAVGAANPTLNAAGQRQQIMELFGPQAFRQSFGTDPAGAASLQQLLAQRGVQFRAFGGPLDPNAFTLVGERGPELISPQMGITGGQQQVMPMTTMANMVMPGGGTGNGPGPNGPILTEPGTFMPQIPQMPNGNPVQQSGAGMLGNQLQNNPEMDVFNQMRQMFSGPGGMLGTGGGGQAVVDAMKPVFQQNLKFGLNELTNRVPSVHNSGAAIEGADLTSRALNDFNLMGAQALMGGQQNTLGAGNLLGQLAGQAGNGQFGRTLAAGQAATQRDLGMGQLGLQQQQQQWNQTVNPTLQLLLAALGAATPTAYQTIVPGKK